LNNIWAMIQKEYWCLIWNMNIQSASSIWSNLLSNATVNIIESVRNCVRGGEANVYGSSYYWNFRTSSFKQVACLILYRHPVTLFTRDADWQAGYWFILRFCEHFTSLSSKIQNAIKLENISNLITSLFSYQCIRSKTRLVYFVIHGRHISMECMWLCAYWGSPNVNFQNKW
jgi:hypothetical protein